MAANSWDGKPSAPLNANPTPQAYLSPDRMTAFSRLSRFGMTFAPLTEPHGADVLTWFLAGFPVKTLAAPEKAQELTANAADSGAKWRGSFARYSHDSRLWKTAQCSLLVDSDEFSEIWPRWGLMQGGACWELTMLAHPTNATESGFWQEQFQTPTVGMVTGGQNPEKGGQIGLGYMARKNLWPTPRSTDHKGATSAHAMQKAADRGFTPNLPEAAAASVNGGQLNPMWVEWLMGWPLGWTDSKPLETGKFLCALQQHGECLEAHE